MVLNTFKDRKVAEISTALSVEQHGQIKYHMTNQLISKISRDYLANSPNTAQTKSKRRLEKLSRDICYLHKHKRL